MLKFIGRCGTALNEFVAEGEGFEPSVLYFISINLLI